MTEIAFHFNAPDKLAYACRLLRKAVGTGAQVVVTAEPELLQKLDVALWTFAPVEFIAHCHADSDAMMVASSPVVLAATLDELPRRQVLVNLGDRIPDGFERFERLIEVVSLDDADRQAARRRWKHYADRGYALMRHDLALKGQS